MPRDSVTPSLQTSQMFRVRGQKSRWVYPDRRLTAEDAARLENINLTENGSGQTRFGYDLYAATALPGNEAVTGFSRFAYPTHGTQTVVCGTTKIYTDNGTTRKDITNGAMTGTADDHYQQVFLQGYAILNNGVDALERWNGDFTTPSPTVTVAGTPFTRATSIFAHKGLLLAMNTTEGGTEYPTRIRWCDLDRRTYTVDIETWIETNRTEVFQGGPAIVGGLDNWDIAWIFTEDGAHTGRVDLDVGRFEFVFQDRFQGFSPVSRTGFVARPEFVFGVAREGCFVFRRDGSFEIVTEDVQNVWRDLNQDRLQYAQARIREKDHQVRVRLSSATNTSGHDTELVWDWITGDVWFDETTDVVNYAQRYISSGEERDFLGSTTGQLFESNIDTVLTDNGTAFTWEITMHANDLGLPGKTKDIQFVRTYLRKKPSSQTVNLNVILDQGDQLTATTSFTAGSPLSYNSGYLYNAGLLYPGGTNERQDFWVNRQARTFAPQWTGSDPVDIAGYDVVFRVLE